MYFQASISTFSNGYCSYDIFVALLQLFLQAQMYSIPKTMNNSGIVSGETFFLHPPTSFVIMIDIHLTIAVFKETSTEMSFLLLVCHFVSKEGFYVIFQRISLLSISCSLYKHTQQHNLSSSTFTLTHISHMTAVIRFTIMII